MSKVIECKQCGEAMRKEIQSKGNLTGIILALIVLAIGISLSAIGLWIIGIPVIILSLFMGGKRVKIWKCPECGYFFERV